MFQVDPNVDGYIPNIRAVVSLKKKNPEKAIHAAGQMLLYLSDWSEKYPEELTKDFLYEMIADIKKLMEVVGPKSYMYNVGRVLLTRMVALCKASEKSYEFVMRLTKKFDKWTSKVNNNRTRLPSYDKVESDIDLALKKLRQSRLLTKSDKLRLIGRLLKLKDVLVEKRAVKVEKQVKKGRILLKEINRALDLAEIDGLDAENIQAIRGMFDEVQLSYVAHLLEGEIDKTYERMMPYI
jgi:hypothetical protein